MFRFAHSFASLMPWFDTSRHETFEPLECELHTHDVRSKARQFAPFPGLRLFLYSLLVQCFYTNCCMDGGFCSVEDRNIDTDERLIVKAVSHAGVRKMFVSDHPKRETQQDRQPSHRNQ